MVHMKNLNQSCQVVIANDIATGFAAKARLLPPAIRNTFPGCHLLTGLVPEPTGQATEARAGLAKVASCGRDVRPPNAAGWHCGPTVLQPTPGPPSWPGLAHHANRAVPSPPRFRQPVFLGQCHPTDGPTEAARRMVRPPEE